MPFCDWSIGWQVFAMVCFVGLGVFLGWFYTWLHYSEKIDKLMKKQEKK